MNKPDDLAKWIGPPEPGEEPAPGYEAWLKAELEAAAKEADEGKITPIEQVRKRYRLE